MRVALIGVGAVGRRIARQLIDTPGLEDLLVAGRDPQSPQAVAAAIGSPARAGAWPEDAAGVDVVVVATGGDHLAIAQTALELGGSVVSVADSVENVSSLLDLDAEARERNRYVVAGAGFSPGLTCVLARHGASTFGEVDEVHVAKVGTGGPACARTHHRALGGEAIDWRDRTWVHRRGGSGRELCWFPDPVGGVDCYRAALPETMLLLPAFPDASRITARVGATRRDRLTLRLPMLRPPHPEGTTGAVRVEIRGTRGSSRDILILGSMDRPAVAAGAVAAVTAWWACDGRLARTGAAGLAELVEPVPFLAELARRGVKAAVFEGSTLA